MPLDLPPGSELYLDSGFTDYGVEDNLREAEDINFFVARRKNSKRPHHPSVDFLISHHLKPIETTFSEITALFLKKIHRSGGPCRHRQGVHPEGHFDPVCPHPE